MKQNYLPLGITVIISVVAIIVGILVGLMFMQQPSSGTFAVFSPETVISESKVGMKLTNWLKETEGKLNSVIENFNKVSSEDEQQLEGRKNYISSGEYEKQLAVIKDKKIAFTETLKKNVEAFRNTINIYSKEITQKAIKIAKRVKTDRELHYILNSAGLIAHDPDFDTNDITGEVIKRINEEMPSMDFELDLEEYEEVTEEL